MKASTRQCASPHAARQTNRVDVTRCVTKGFVQLTNKNKHARRRASDEPVVLKQRSKHIHGITIGRCVANDEPTHAAKSTRNILKVIFFLEWLSPGWFHCLLVFFCHRKLLSSIQIAMKMMLTTSRNEYSLSLSLYLF